MDLHGDLHMEIRSSASHERYLWTMSEWISSMGCSGCPFSLGPVLLLGLAYQAISLGVPGLAESPAHSAAIILQNSFLDRSLQFSYQLPARKQEVLSPPYGVLCTSAYMNQRAPNFLRAVALQLPTFSTDFSSTASFPQPHYGNSYHTIIGQSRTPITHSEILQAFIGAEAAMELGCVPRLSYSWRTDRREDKSNALNSSRQNYLSKEHCQMTAPLHRHDHCHYVLQDRGGLLWRYK